MGSRHGAHGVLWAWEQTNGGCRDAEQQKRIAAFHVTQDVLARLRTCEPYADQKLLALLEKLHENFAAWPEVQTALKLPAVHKLRLSHWQRMVSGRFDDGYLESASRLAAAFITQGVPSYAVVICHSTVLYGLFADLQVLGGKRAGFFGSGREAKATSLIRLALNHAAWLDLEVPLETYAAAERDSRRKTADQLATAFEQKVSFMVEGVAAASRQLEATVHAIEQTAARSQQGSSSAAAVEEQGATTREIARNVQQAAAGNQQVSGMMAALKDDASATLKVVEDLTQAATGLDSQSDALQAAVDGFLREVRAA